MRKTSRTATSISIHAPPRRATSPGKISLHAFLISIHAPPRGATALRTRRDACARISIHAPPRGATCFHLLFCEHVCDFNSRPSARGDWVVAGDYADMVFQFTPLREGRRDGRQQRRNCQVISIHAPPRGATSTGYKQVNRRCISIHAPPRGATGDFRYDDWSGAISIHAPPRGATDAIMRYMDGE